VIKPIYLVYVELETTPCIGAQQKLYAEVRELLQRRGFADLATDHPRDGSQFNALFVRCDLPARMRLAVRSRLLRARARHVLVSATRTLCPACLRRYRAMRLRKTSYPSPAS
jgi:hypothetical protein